MNEQDINIIDFELDDEALFCDMAYLFHNSDDVAYGKADMKVLQSTFHECINNSPYIRGMFICQNGVVCGYALLTFSYSNEYGGKIMIIDEIYIKEGFRGEGLASYFIRETLAEYQHKVVYVEVEVRKDNAAAISLYKKFGLGVNDYLLMYKFFDRD